MTKAIFQIIPVLFLGLFLISCAPPAGDAPSTYPLIAYYPLDGDTKDYSSNQWDGSMAGSGPGTVSAASDRLGATNKAYSFDVANDAYIDVPRQKMISGAAISVSFWVKVTITANYWNYFIAGNDFGVYYDNSTTPPTIKFSISLDTIGTNSASTQVSTDAWTHIVGTYDGSDIKIYKNSMLQATRHWTGYPMADPARDLTIGEYPPFGALTSTVDEVRIYDKVLSDAEIQALYWVNNFGTKFNEPFDSYNSSNWNEFAGGPWNTASLSGNTVIQNQSTNNGILLYNNYTGKTGTDYTVSARVKPGTTNPNVCIMGRVTTGPLYCYSLSLQKGSTNGVLLLYKYVAGSGNSPDPTGTDLGVPIDTSKYYTLTLRMSGAVISGTVSDGTNSAALEYTDNSNFNGYGAITSGQIGLLDYSASNTNPNSFDDVKITEP
jgi:hypothetical protein